MKLNPNKYLITLNNLKPQLLESTNLLKTCSELAVSSHCPLLAVIEFCRRPDVFGDLPELQKKAILLVEFYGYKEIVPWEK